MWPTDTTVQRDVTNGFDLFGFDLFCTRKTNLDSYSLHFACNYGNELVFDSFCKMNETNHQCGRLPCLQCCPQCYRLKCGRLHCCSLTQLQQRSHRKYWLHGYNNRVFCTHARASIRVPCCTTPLTVLQHSAPQPSSPQLAALQPDLCEFHKYLIHFNRIYMFATNYSALFKNPWCFFRTLLLN